MTVAHSLSRSTRLSGLGTLCRAYLHFWFSPWSFSLQAQVDLFNLPISLRRYSKSTTFPTLHFPTSVHNKAIVRSRCPSTMSSALISSPICPNPRKALKVNSTLYIFCALAMQGNFKCCVNIWERLCRTILFSPPLVGIPFVLPSSARLIEEGMSSRSSASRASFIPSRKSVATLLTL